jgi:hypothetical protein
VIIGMGPYAYRARGSVTAEGRGIAIVREEKNASVATIREP